MMTEHDTVICFLFKILVSDGKYFRFLPSLGNLDKTVHKYPVHAHLKRCIRFTLFEGKKA